MDVKKIYKKLLAHFGPQGWWPIFDRKLGKCVYGHCKSDSFEICVGAILTQNTAWKNVEKALANLHQVCHPERPRACRGGVEGSQVGLTPQFIFSCKNLEKLIQPAGYYNQKAKKLRIFSEWWLKKPQIIMTRPCHYNLRRELLNIWGIGPETADSMLLYAFNKPVFVIDAYTKRLCKEFDTEFKTYDEYRNFFESQLPKSVKLFNEYHALIVAWGKLHAKDKILAAKIIK